MERDVKMIPLTKIHISPGRGRKDFSNIKELMSSIEQYGILHPLVVEATPLGDYNLIAGECRLRCLLLLKKTEAPCSILGEMNILRRKELELTENVARTDLSWPERVELYRQIDECKRELHGEKMQGASAETNKDKWSMEKTAAMVGISKGAMSINLKFARTLKDRPDIKAIVKDLPLSAAIRKTDLLIQQEKLSRMHANGQLAITQELLLGDACELIKKVPDASVDLILTDGPFGIAALEEGTGLASETYKSVIQGSDNMTLKDARFLYLNLIPELFRVLKPSAHIYMFCTVGELYPDLITLLKENGFLLAPVPLIWDKQRITTSFKGMNYCSCYEAIIFGSKPPRPRILATSSRDVLRFSSIGSKKKWHPFEKPQELLRFLIEQSSNLGDLVLDPFAGSASTLAAARNMGRRALGFELNENNYRSAQQRLSLKGDEDAASSKKEIPVSGADASNAG